MWGILISTCFFLVNLPLSSLLTRNEYRQIRAQSTDYMSACSVQSININKPRNKLNQEQNHALLGFTSSWKRMIKKSDDKESDESDETESNESDENESEEIDDHFSHHIQVIFNIPYSFSNGSILNETVLITNAINNRLIESSIHICINGTSFIINYSTDKSLPHNVCLYLLLNITASISLKEIFTCEVINDNSSLDTHDDHSIGPSAVFIISQGVMSFLMMFIICMVHTARKRHVASRINQRLFHKKLLPRTNKIDLINIEATTENNLPLEDRVLSAVDLTSIRNDRRYTNHSLIDVKEFTKKLSLSTKASEDTHF